MVNIKSLLTKIMILSEFNELHSQVIVNIHNFYYSCVIKLKNYLIF